MPDTVKDPITELTANFASTAQGLFRAGSVTETLQTIVDLAVATIDGCELAGIFIREGATVTTPVWTDPFVVEVDAIQQRLAEGPCLDALLKGGAFYAGDLVDDPRWPRFGPEAAKAGMRGLLALRLSGNGTLGALNLYTRLPLAFGIVDRAKALIFATMASEALAAAYLHEGELRRVEELHDALTTRELIGQAQGILMERERITGDQAFDILRRASQHLNVKLREVAFGLVETGEMPHGGPRQPLA